MIHSIKIRNYKCFGEEFNGFEKILPINLIIGKNNAGKSSLVDLIAYLLNPSEDLVGVTAVGKRAQVLLSGEITQKLIDFVYPLHPEHAVDHNERKNKEGQKLIGSVIQFFLNGNERTLNINASDKASVINQYKGELIYSMDLPLKGKTMLKIDADRDIVPENTSYQQPKPNGNFTTSFVREIINNNKYDRKIVEIELLKELNKIINPDIFFKDIVVEHDDNNKWEINFSDIDDRYIPLSKMGSGLKTILLVLINLIVIPKIQGLSESNYVFCFEELENNLHPSLLKKLFNYISNYTKEKSACFFITTHSNVVIDLFGSEPNVQILHIQKQNKVSTVQTIVSPYQGKQILLDLGIRASDVLLSNGVIWVEGPSDSIYLELFIQLYKMTIQPTTTGRFNYTIQALSTSLWKYAGFKDFDWSKIKGKLENEVILLTKLNHNHLIIIDKDDNYEDKKPSEWNSFADGTGKNKARLINELMEFSQYEENDLINNFGDAKNNNLFFWINDGTIETYLQYFLLNKGKGVFKKYFDFGKSKGYLEKKRNGLNSSISKVELASNIANHFIENNLTFNDIAPLESELENKIKRLYETIKFWN